MAMPITCPTCAVSFRLSEGVRGGNVFCPRCGQSLVVTSDGTPKHGERQPRAPGPATRDWKGLLVLVLAGLVLLLGGLALGLYLSRDRHEGRQPLARQGQEPTAAEKTLHKLSVAQPAPSPPPPPDKRPADAGAGQKVEPKQAPPADTTTKAPDEAPSVKPGARFVPPLGALGKPERLAAVKGVRLEVQWRSGKAPVFPLTWTWVGIRKWHLEVHNPKGSTALPAIAIVIAGDKGWLKLGDAIKPISRSGVDLVADYAFAYNGVAELTPLSRADFHLSVVGPSAVKDRPADCVRMAAKGLRELKLYFDRDTHLLGKVECRGYREWILAGAQVDVGAVENNDLIELYFSDYRETDGIKHWRRLQVYRNGAITEDWEVTSVRFLSEVDERLFVAQ